MEQKPAHFIFISDLHLAGGFDPQQGRFRRKESFFYDQAFSHFLANLQQRAESNPAGWRLVLLGDVLDFLRVDLPEPVPDGTASLAAALLKLDQIFLGHPAFFEGLARLLEAGVGVDVLPGNHDIELIHPAVQQRFTELLAGWLTGPPAGQLRFFPWIYFIPGLLYAEHGQQYHSINAFHTLLHPYLSAFPTRFELPIGSHFETYLYRLLSRAGSDEQAAAASILKIARILIAHPVPLLLGFPDHLAFLEQIGRPSLHRRQRRSARRLYRRESLKPYAVEAGLNPAVVTALDELSESSPARDRQRLWRMMAATLRRRTADPVSYLFTAARAVHLILAQAGQTVSFYVFGHTHQAADLPLFPQVPARYLNCGSWTADLPEQPGKAFTFVEISRHPGAGVPEACLFLWDEAAGMARDYPAAVT